MAHVIKLKHIGKRGLSGQGVPAGGTTGQVLAKDSNSDYDTEWIDQSGGEVSSVNGQIGAVVLTKSNVGLSNVPNIDATIRSNHTGTQLSSTVSDFSASVDSRISSAIGVSVQAYDADLNAISALSPANDDIMQRKAGSWTNRTPAQLKTDLSLTKTDVGLPNVPNVDATLRANHTGVQLASTISNFDVQVRTSRLDQMALPTNSLDLNSNKLTGLLNPDTDQDAANKGYVDGVAQGLRIKTAVKYATASALPSNNYSSGIITASANGALSIDGEVTSVNDRILVKDETTQANNGIYSVTQVGDGSSPFILTRVTDMDEGSEVPGAFVFVQAGDTNIAKGFVVAGEGPFTVGTTPIVFTQFSAAGLVIAGSGLLYDGNVINVVGASNKITVSADSIDINESNLTHDNIGGTLGIIKGGTGATTASSARTALGLVIGTDIQGFDSDLSAIASISPTNDDIIQRKAGAWVSRTMIQLKTDLALTKSDVGLGSVDNTSDLGKPISTATQSALDLKAPLASPSLTGTPTAPTASSGTSTTQLATTAFVEGEIVSNVGIAQVYYVTTTGSDSNNGQTWGTAFATIEHAFTVGQASSMNTPFTVYVGGGTFTINTVVTITRLQSLVGMGAARTIIENAVNGPAFIYTGVSPEVTPYSTTNYPNVGLKSFTIRPSGTPGTDTAGIKVQDIVFPQITNVFANGFTGVRGVGIWVFNKELPNGVNPGGFVERLQLKQVATDNNTYGILLDRLIAGQPLGINDYRTDQVGYGGYGNTSTNADNSVMYHTWVGVSINARAVAAGANAQIGLQIQKGVQFYHGSIGIQFNITGVNGSNTVAPIALNVQNSSAVNSGDFVVRGEANGTGAYSVVIDDTSTIDYVGLLDFLYSSSFQAAIIGTVIINGVTLTHNGNFKFSGGANGLGLTNNTTQATKPIHSIIEKTTLAGAANTAPPNGPALRTMTGLLDATHPAFDLLRITNQRYGLNSYDGTTTLTYFQILQDATRPIMQAVQGLRVQSGSNVYSGSGAPNLTGSGAGDFYIRTDASTNYAQILYICTGSNVWVPLATFNPTTGIRDVNGNLIVGFNATASAVNYLVVQNAIAGQNIAFKASNGGTGNVGMSFRSQEQGIIKFAPGTDTITGIQFLKADNTTVILNADSSNGRVGIGTATPTRTLDVVGAARIQQILGSSASVPTVTADTGAGTSPNIVPTGNDIGGKIVIVAGTTPSNTADIVDIAFGSAYPNAPSVTLTPGNTAAAALMSGIYAGNVSTTGFSITTGPTALTNTTQYIWYYHVVGI